jgi:hypothetical protein
MSTPIQRFLLVSISLGSYYNIPEASILPKLGATVEALVHFRNRVATEYDVAAALTLECIGRNFTQIQIHAGPLDRRDPVACFIEDTMIRKANKAPLREFGAVSRSHQDAARLKLIRNAHGTPFLGNELF